MMAPGIQGMERAGGNGYTRHHHRPFRRPAANQGQPGQVASWLTASLRPDYAAGISTSISALLTVPPSGRLPTTLYVRSPDGSGNVNLV